MKCWSVWMKDEGKKYDVYIKTEAMCYDEAVQIINEVFPIELIHSVFRVSHKKYIELIKVLPIVEGNEWKNHRVCIMKKIF